MSRPVNQTERDNLAISNAVENDNKEKTLTALYNKQREMKAEMEKFAAGKKQEHIRELTAEAKPAWDEVSRRANGFITESHGYGAGWGRLYDFAFLLQAALEKQGAIFRASYGTPVYTAVSNVALGATGGLVGGLVGGVGSFFGGDGIIAGAKNGAMYALGMPNDQLHYFVEFNETRKKLEFRLDRTDGKALTPEEQAGFKADVDCWYKKQGSVAMTKAEFAKLRDNAENGLAKYLKDNHLEVLQTAYAQKLKDEEPEVRQSPSMSM